MATNPIPQVTDFTRDVIGRYVCNGLDEALRSADKNRPDTRPFDVIVIGGGSFGPIVAQHLFYRAKGHRILVLEGGPFVLPEHVQNLPLLGLAVPGSTSIADLRAVGQDRLPRSEVWGLAWHSPVKFPGLAYCLGGRSVFFGGWSPQLLDAEMPAARWPKSVVDDLTQSYLREAGEQIGITETNDFIYGPLHTALRQRLVDGIKGGKVTDAIPLGELPDHPALPRGTRATAEELLDLLGLPGQRGTPPARKDLLDLLKVEAPLAVQSRTRPGLFPFNKFSAVPLLIKAARAAWAESQNDDAKKRLMIVPQCHVTRLATAGGRVTAVETNRGTVPVSPGAAVVLALGTIESARLALLSFESIPSYGMIGQNLMAHLRSNLTIRIPRAALSIDPAIKELQASALFLKGRHQQAGRVGHFHLQITAAGLGALGTDSEAELFKKIPDFDTFDAFRAASDTHIVITIRGIGEMERQNPNSHVTLDPEPDEFGLRRALVAIEPTANDLRLWEAMDRAADEVARVFTGGPPYEVLTPAGVVPLRGVQSPAEVLPFAQRRDGLGTTHHEAGTLWMGTDPGKSVTNPDGRFHHVSNAYVAGPALFPTIGSPNPMLTGVALARRLADHLALDRTPRDAFLPLFDGLTTDNWRMAGRGIFVVVGGTLEAVPGGDLGLYWCTTPMPPDFVLALEWRRASPDDNSGVFLRLPDPNSKGYDNPAWVGVHFGFEVQIDEVGAPDGAAIHKTGAIYGEPIQTLTPQPARPVGEWNEFEIRVQGQTYTVFLNGVQVTAFRNPHTNRGLPSTANTPSFIGLQAHTGRVAFRNIRVKKL